MSAPRFEVFDERDGSRSVLFHCPGCGYSHAFRVAGEGRPMWTWNGDLDRATFAPSLLYRLERTGGGVHVCHSYVREGRIQFLNDCTHTLAGQTVDVPPID